MKPVTVFLPEKDLAALRQINTLLEEAQFAEYFALCDRMKSKALVAVLSSPCVSRLPEVANG